MKHPFLLTGVVVMLAIGTIVAWSNHQANRESELVAKAAKWLPSDQFDIGELKQADEVESDPERALGQAIGRQWRGPVWSKIVEKKIVDEDMMEGSYQPQVKAALVFTQKVGVFFLENSPCQKSLAEAARLNDEAVRLYAKINSLEVDASTKPFKLRLRCWMLVWMGKYNGLLPQFIELSKLNSTPILALNGANANYSEWKGKTTALKDPLKKFFGETKSQTWDYLNNQVGFLTDNTHAWKVSDDIGTIASPIIAESARKVAEGYPLEISSDSTALAKSVEVIRSVLGEHTVADKNSKLRRVLEARANTGEKILEEISKFKEQPEEQHDYAKLCEAISGINAIAASGECTTKYDTVVDWIKSRRKCDPAKPNDTHLTAAWVKGRQAALAALTKSAPTPELSKLVADEAEQLSSFADLPTLASIEAMNAESKRIASKIKSKPFPLLDRVAADRQTLVMALRNQVTALNASFTQPSQPEEFNTSFKPDQLGAESDEGKLFSSLEDWAKSVGELREKERSEKVATQIDEINNDWIKLTFKTKVLVGAYDLEETIKKESAPWKALAAAKNDTGKLDDAWEDYHSKCRSGWAVAICRKLLDYAPHCDTPTSLNRAEGLQRARINELKKFSRIGSLEIPFQVIISDTDLLSTARQARLNFLSAKLDKPNFEQLDVVKRAEFNQSLKKSYDQLSPVAKAWLTMFSAETKCMTVSGEKETQDAFTELKKAARDALIKYTQSNAAIKSTLEGDWLDKARKRFESSDAVASWSPDEWENKKSLIDAKNRAEKKSLEWAETSENLKNLWDERAKSLGLARALLIEGVKTRWENSNDTTIETKLNDPTLRRWWRWHPDTMVQAQEFKADLECLRSLQKNTGGLIGNNADNNNFEDKAIKNIFAQVANNKTTWNPWLKPMAENLQQEFDACRDLLNNLTDLYESNARNVDIEECRRSVQNWISSTKNKSWHNDALNWLMSAHAQRAEYFLNKSKYKIKLVISTNHDDYFWSHPNANLHSDEWCMVKLEVAKGDSYSIGHVELDGESNAFKKNDARFYSTNNEGVVNFIDWKMGDAVTVKIIHQIDGKEYRLTPCESSTELLPVTTIGLFSLQNIPERASVGGRFKFEITPVHSSYSFPNMKRLDILKTPEKQSSKKLAVEAKRDGMEFLEKTFLNN